MIVRVGIAIRLEEGSKSLDWKGTENLVLFLSYLNFRTLKLRNSS